MNKNSVVKNIYRQYANGAKTRNIKFDLRIDEFKRLIVQDCFYCKCPSVNSRYFWDETIKDNDSFSWNGIDRIDNNIGYVLENCVPCCRICNIIKRDLSLDEFFIRIAHIYHAQIESKPHVFANRVCILERKIEKIIEILNDYVGMRIKQDGTIYYPVKERMKEKELFTRIVAKDVENAPRLEEDSHD